MSQKKTIQNYTVEELINELSTLVKNITKGEIHVGSNLLSITDPVSFKVKQKIKDSVLLYELSFHAPLKQQKLKKSSVHKKPAKQTNSTQLQEQALKSTKNKSKKPSTKNPKKEIARLWKLVTQKIESGSTISNDIADPLRNLCESSMYKDKKWKEDWVSCCQKVEASIEAAIKGDYNSAKDLVAEVKDMTHICHKKYK